MADRYFSPQPNVPGRGIVAGYGMGFWGLVVAIGLFAGLAGGLLLKLLTVVEHLAWNYSSGSFLDAVESASDVRRVAVLLVAGLVAGVGAIVIRYMRGIGGSEVSEALWIEDGQMALGPSLGRGLLSIVVVGLGASLGREAAPQLAGAAFASRLCDRAGIPRWQRRLLVACGAGAGMAAVYNIPLGGALFALEVLLGTITLPLVLPALLTTMIATAIAWILLGNGPTYVVPSYHVAVSQIAWAAIVGPLAGLGAAVWVNAIARVHRMRPHGRQRVIRPIVGLTVLGLIAIPYPELLGNGKDTVELAITGGLGAGLMLILGVLKPIVTAECLWTGAPGGLFTPTLTYGVLLGGFLGHVWSALWPGAPDGTYALIGGGAVLAASMQGPLSAIVMMIELAQHTDALMVPLLLAVAGATIVARLLGAPSIYSARLGEKALRVGRKPGFRGGEPDEVEDTS